MKLMNNRFVQAGAALSIVATLATTTITPASGTICGLSSISLQPGQFLSIGAGASTDYACALGLPASVPSGTIASGKNLGYDSSNRLVTAPVSMFTFPSLRPITCFLHF